MLGTLVKDLDETFDQNRNTEDPDPCAVPNNLALNSIIHNCQYFAMFSRSCWCRTGTADNFHMFYDVPFHGMIF